MSMHRLYVPFDVKGVSEKEIEGHGAVFGNVDLGADIIVKGAFAKSLEDHRRNGTRLKMLWNHRHNDLPIGTWTEFREDDYGLYVRGEIADTQMGRDVRTLAKMRAIDTMSIGYLPIDFDFDRHGNRVLKEIEVYEVSPVNFAMNPQATIEAVKSQFSTPRALEKHLRDVGCSIKTAKTIVSDLLGSSGTEDDSAQRDVDDDLLEAAKHLNEVFTAGVFRSQLRRTSHGKSPFGGNAKTG